MKKVVFLAILFSAMCLSASRSHAQEQKEFNVEQSSEVFLEEYSDDFQENFFEALKQKGIENYDKAINYLLKCKQLDDKNRVVDHELAKAYLLDKQYPAAQEYAIVALNSEPENPWYLDTLVEVLEKQGASIEVAALTIPFTNSKLKENLALNYYRRGKYENAKMVLEDVKRSAFTEDLKIKIIDSIEKQQSESQTFSFSTTGTETDPGEPNSLQSYTLRIDGLLRTDSTLILAQVAEQAVENYPAQPYFYYAQGYALNKNAKYRDAIAILETALDYLVGDIALENKIYVALAEAYNGVNNSVKANMYLRKVKPGF